MDTLLIVPATANQGFWQSFTVDNWISLFSSLLTFVIAAAALGQWRSSQKAHRQENTPIVKSDFHFPGVRPGMVTLTNSGLGPALLQEINIFLGGKKFEGILKEACEEAIHTIGDTSGAPLVVTRNYEYQRGYPIGRDETIRLVEFRFFNESRPNVGAIKEETEKKSLQIEVVYQDIFGRRHVALDPQPGNTL
ncbi:hypothetical protein [Billgrantia saliphila]|uniref:hypothetical protein n=1 Tax=Billgrantia saliphila TaxID=1848458 RepID=UPI000CE3C888|nr:hypothetical protein [Halomonas saliphila]